MAASRRRTAVRPGVAPASEGPATKRRRIRLIDWNKDQIEKKAGRLYAAGYEVEHDAMDPTAWREMRANPPEAVIVDLSRAPSLGRDLALAIRKSRATRFIPLVFADGEASYTAAIKKLLPDAIFTPWSRIRSALKEAVNRTVTGPAVPTSVFAGYAGTPLPRKLGIKQNAVVALVGAPLNFESMLRDLPRGVRLKRTPRGANDLLVWFTRSRAELEGRIKAMSGLAGKGGLWILWPKRASGIQSDLTPVLVNKAAEKAGFVEHKVASIDRTWTGFWFASRKARR